MSNSGARGRGGARVFSVDNASTAVPEQTPEDWEFLKIGEIFTRRQQHGLPGLPIMSITMSGGLVERDSVDRRVDSNLRPEGHLLVRKGDLAYNMMRMWQGVLGRAKFDCLVSPAYVVLEPGLKIDPTFAEHLFSTKTAIAEFKRLSYGVVDDRLRLYYRDLVRIPFPIPHSLAEQREIAGILSALDETIRQTEALITKYQQVRSGMLQDLFTRGVTPDGRLRATHIEAPHLYGDSPRGWIPRGWEAVTLDSVLAGIDAGWSPECDDVPPASGEWAVLKVSAVTSGVFEPFQSKVLPRTATPRADIEVHTGDILMARANGVAALVGITAEVRNCPPHLMLSDKVLRLRTRTGRCLSSFLGRIMSLSAVRSQIETAISGSSGQKNISQAEIRRLEISLPPVDEQARCVDRLMAIEARLEVESRYLKKLRIQKLGLMHDLLTGRMRIKTANLEDVPA